MVKKYDTCGGTATPPGFFSMKHAKGEGGWKTALAV
jgi:hypothetical protein